MDWNLEVWLWGKMEGAKALTPLSQAAKAFTPEGEGKIWVIVFVSFLMFGCWPPVDFLDIWVFPKPSEGSQTGYFSPWARWEVGLARPRKFFRRWNHPLKYPHNILYIYIYILV